MILCIDIGNTQITGAFYHKETFSTPWKINSKERWSIEEVGKYVQDFMEQHQIAADILKNIVVSSVVPSLNEKIEKVCIEYFNIKPLHITGECKLNFTSKYFKPAEIGTDIIANIAYAVELYKGRDIIIVDMGTATTITAVTKDRVFISGVILPGVETQLKALTKSAEQLSEMKIGYSSENQAENDKKNRQYNISNIEKNGKIFANDACGDRQIIATTTDQAIKNGVYFGAIGAIKNIITELSKESGFKNPVIIGTGGYSIIFKEKNIFSVHLPRLIMHGILHLFHLN